MSDQKNNTKPALPNSQSNNVKPSNKNIIGISSLILVIAATGFFQYRVETLVMKNSELEKHLSIITQSTQSQAQQSGQLTQSLTQNKDQLDSMTGQLAFMQQTLNQIPGARLEDWKLAEVEYLLRLGNQRVTLQKETAGAAALFDAANQILAELDDPSLLLVREKIAQEMLLLGNAKEIDQQGIYAQIQALKSLIHDTIQPPNTFTQTQPVPAVITTDSNGENTDVSTSLLQQLLSLVSVRTRDQAFDAPLATAQYQLLEHSLVLMLEQAQWALLKGDQTLYSASLSNAQTWIENTLRHQQAESMLAAIVKLKALTISAKLPDVSQSLRLLRQIVKDRTYAPSPVKTAPVIENKDTKEKTDAQKQEQA